MTDVDEGSSGEPELYVVFLGGELSPGRMGEDHEVVVVVASTVKEARAAARAKWSGSAKGHVDATRVIKVVDGYEILLRKTDREDASELDVTYEPAYPEAGG